MLASASIYIVFPASKSVEYNFLWERTLGDTKRSLILSPATNAIIILLNHLLKTQAARYTVAMYFRCRFPTPKEESGSDFKPISLRHRLCIANLSELLCRYPTSHQDYTDIGPRQRVFLFHIYYSRYIIYVAHIRENYTESKELFDDKLYSSCITKTSTRRVTDVTIL